MQRLAGGDVWCECRRGGCQKDSEVLFEGGAADFFRFDCQVMNTTGYVSRGFKLVTNLAARKWDGFMP